MQTTFKLFFSCLFCFSLILLNGCGTHTGKNDFGITMIPIGDQSTFKIVNTREINTQEYGFERFSVVVHVSVFDMDERSFTERYKDCSTELIDRVTTVLHTSTTEERKEAGNMAIKERMKQAINGVLGMPWVREVIFTEISHEVVQGACPEIVEVVAEHLSVQEASE